MNIYVDNVLIFNEVIDGKDKLGQKTLHYRKIDNNSLLQMIGRIGRFKPGRAVIISDTPDPEEDRPGTCAQGARDRDPVRPRAPDVEVRPQALGARVHVEGEPPRGRVRRGLADRDRGDRPPHPRDNMEGAPDERDPLRPGLCPHDLERAHLRRLRDGQVPAGQRRVRRLAEPRLQDRDGGARPPVPLRLRQVERAQHQGDISSSGYYERTGRAPSSRGSSRTGYSSGSSRRRGRTTKRRGTSLNDLLVSSEKEAIPRDVST